MLNRSVFKAYDVRGIYPKDVNEETIDAVASALSHIWTPGDIVIACDGRNGSDALSKHAAENINALGKFKAVYVGLSTTPMFYFLVNHLNASGGMMITASHNPKEYNGVKAVKKNAEAISGKELLEIIDKHARLPSPEGVANGGQGLKNFKSEYVAFLKKFLDIKKPLKVVFDGGHGPAGGIVKDVFANSPVEMILINENVDPNFPNRTPNPLLPGASDPCKNAITKHDADLGVMFDADADRAIFVNKEGELVPAFAITALLANVFTPPFVVDELVYESLKFLNAIPDPNLLPSRIGAYFIKKEMAEKSLSFGAEYSGHYYFKDFFGLDSGIFTAIAVLNALTQNSTTLEEVQTKYGDHEIVTIEISTEGKDMSKLLASLEEAYGKEAKNIEHRDGVTFVFDNFWTNIRGSNTEPILRIVAGGNSNMHEKLKEIEGFVREN